MAKAAGSKVRTGEKALVRQLRDLNVVGSISPGARNAVAFLLLNDERTALGHQTMRADLGYMPAEASDAMQELKDALTVKSKKIPLFGALGLTYNKTLKLVEFAR